MSIFPDATTTGIRDGVVLSPHVTEFVTSFDGQDISGVDADIIIVNHDNVTITDCLAGSIISGTVPSNAVTGTVIQYCDVYGRNSLNSIDMESDGSIIQFCDISGSENGIWLEADNVLIQENYIHNLFSNTGSPDPHIDGIQVPGSNIGAAVSSNDVIYHNTIDLDVRTATSCIISLDWDNMLIDNNYFSGGAYTVYLLGNADGTMTNNVFGEHAFGYIDVEVGSQTTVPNPVSGPWNFSGNVDAVTGALLSFNNGPPPDPVAGSVVVDNVSITEGNSGTKLATFTLTRSGGTLAFDVNYATSDSTAVAGSDYVATSGVLSFAAGQNTATFSVVVNGDTAIEADETFNVNLSGATNGATIGDNLGIGTITNDDVAPPPTVISGTTGHDTLRGTSGNDTINGLGGQDHIDGAAGDDLIHGNGGKDFIDGGAGADVLWGDAGSDQFIFKAGETNGDSVMDFVGNGNRTGDLLMFFGYGDAQDGASFTRIDASHWQVHSAIDGHNEIINMSANVAATDYLFL